MRLYIAVLDRVPDFMVPTLVAHTVLGAHMSFIKTHTDFSSIIDYGPYKHPQYINWLGTSFKKCVVSVNQREFDKIAALPHTYLGYENTVLGGMNSCAIPLPIENDELPNVLKFAKLWKTKYENTTSSAD